MIRVKKIIYPYILIWKKILKCCKFNNLINNPLVVHSNIIIFLMILVIHVLIKKFKAISSIKIINPAGHLIILIHFLNNELYRSILWFPRINVYTQTNFITRLNLWAMESHSSRQASLIKNAINATSI